MQFKDVPEQEPGGVCGRLGFMRGYKVDHTCRTVRDCKNGIEHLSMSCEIGQSHDPINADLLPLAGRELDRLEEALLTSSVCFYASTNGTGLDKLCYE